MSSNYLTLTNRVLKAFGEVPLTSSTFASATGFYSDVQDGINQAILDIHKFEDTDWPFAWNNTTFNTVVGQSAYTRADTYTSVNWESFRILRGSFVLSSLTQTAGTATAISTGNHNLITGDTLLIYGSTPTDYNGTVTVTVVDNVTFTFPIGAAVSSPATGTINCLSEIVVQKPLQFKPWDFYTDEGYFATDSNMDPSGWTTPKFVVRRPDNNIVLSTPPDRIYSVYYEGFQLPNALAAYNDTSIIPTVFDQVIVNKALYYAYMFRDNSDEAALADDKYNKSVTEMRRILIPQQPYANASD
jgi:hypothetical protein